MPRHKDEYRTALAKAVGISHDKTRKISIKELERRAEMDESARSLLAPRPKRVGSLPRYQSPVAMITRTQTKEFRSRHMAEEVAYLLERMTGESCTVTQGYGEYVVIRHCAGGKMEVV